MRNEGLFSRLFIEEIRDELKLDDNGQGRMATLAQKWQTRDDSNSELLWDSFLKQAISYLQFVPPQKSTALDVYPLFEDYSFTSPVTILYFVSPKAEIDDVLVGQFWPGKLVAELKKRNLNWGILTNGAKWRLYSLKTAKPYEDFIELDLISAISGSVDKEYALFERFFHRDSFVKGEEDKDQDERSKLCKIEDSSNNEKRNTESNSDSPSLYKCRLDKDAERSEEVLEELVKNPLLSQVDEILQYVCNGFIADTERKGVEYTEEERREIFESAVKLLYRTLFLFYAEARSLLPSDPNKAEEYRKHSIRYLCAESRRFRWNQRKDTDGYDLWKHLKGLVNAVNDGDLEYGIMGYNGGLFDDQQERFLGKHKLRNDYLSRSLYLLAYVEPWDNDPDKEYAIPYEDLEVRHLGELYENILEFNVTLADADRIRRRTKKGVELLLASDMKLQPGDTRIKKGDIFFGETALERKQTGSYYTPEVLVQFLNQKAIRNPLRKRFEKDYRKRFNEFCSDAQGGRDTSTRRGATQSAIALIERFIHEVVLKFKTCDPGMGSGHFLVNAANQISDLIVELLSEIPYVEGMQSKTTCAPNHWRRQVTRHCVYGVDLNPLAVHLAKLSLWLNCFAQDHRLTFLDHHLKCGNSLIGIRTLDQLEKTPERAKEKKWKNRKQLQFPLEIKKACQRALGEICKIENLDEDSTDKMKELSENAKHESSNVISLADLYTSYLIDHSIDEKDYLEVFSDFAQGEKSGRNYTKEILRHIKELRIRHHYFHWALEFPEIFGIAQPGFDAATGNPPWDILKPNSQEFFSTYDPDFRRYEKQEASKVIERLTDKHERIRIKWNTYCQGFEEQSLYVRQPSAYRAVGNGDINTFKLYLEQFFTLLRTDGFMGILTPSGLYTDLGCLLLRKMFFEKSRIDSLYCFENRKAIFNIHRSFKFILFCVAKGGKTESFKCAFMEHDPARLQIIEENALEMKVTQVRKFSPDSLSIMEFKDQRDFDVTTHIYNEWPLLGEELNVGWNVKFNAELHMTNDSALFVSKEKLKDSQDCVRLWEGKQIWLLSDGYAEPNVWVRKSDVSSLSSVQKTRLVYRALAASTNERTLIATVIPAGSPCGHSINVAPMLAKDAMFVVALFSSFVLDFIIRLKVTTNLTMYYLYQMPVPRDGYKGQSRILQAIRCRVARLVCSSKEFNTLWEEVFDPKWKVWYPRVGLIDYGPKHEREVRERLAEEAFDLTPNWTKKCGVHDRLPDHRDTGDRAQLRAEIDAFVALLYDLNRDEFAYILDTFPVLKKKELKAFGEFRSKRKCLEEYDRIGKVLGRE